MLLAINAVVSYRSIPRILELFKLTVPFESNWTPNFTSVINWTLRLGLGLLKQVKTISEPWVAIIDHSIDIGTKKVLVVLRVPVEALSKRGSAIQLQDCECIGLSVSEKVTGETISPELEKIFTQAGNPVAIIKDTDATLNKGVRLCSEKQEKPIPIIDDIGHAMANALKAQFEKTASYKRFNALLSYGAKCLRQTDLAFITPPKLRSKGRFLRHRKLGKWGTKMLNVFAVKGRASKGSMLDRIRNAFPDLIKSRSFIEYFALTTKIVSEVMKILKNKGLNKATYKQCYDLSKKLPRNSFVAKCLQAWLKRNIEVHKPLRISKPLIVSSDIIESLFGKFKYAIERSPQSDMNRTVLLIPALCGNLDGEIITQALNQASCSDLDTWEKDNIPYTIRKRRQAFFSQDENPKSGEL
ncbi:MAG: hypothetical protein DRR00_33050 [Candidatus Parabeggiatoa sp. nov. 3]|nr:MAG: hypothetical protein DRR00_33050 [Gammaproteobacteria bacterium]RKZ55273.1 MAG: hypothetical protein DRQ99_30230 [Gammaproteobacteria bacterium]